MAEKILHRFEKEFEKTTMNSFFEKGQIFQTFCQFGLLLKLLKKAFSCS